MKSTTLKYILIWASFPFLVQCVSVSFDGGSTGKHAEGVKVKEPKTPFVSSSEALVDGSWKNPRNGNTISYLSDCGDSADPSLDSIVQGPISALADLHIESTQSITVQGREARRVLASGKVDGVQTQIDILTFKRNRCIFILTYVGVARSFAQDHAAFDNFIGEFRAP